MLDLLRWLVTLPERSKGNRGESRINKIIERNLGENEYLIEDATLHTEDGTTQIDHIIVSTYGIFVIETKNMDGWIFGDSDLRRKEWTQTIYRYSNKFPNPLRQNYGHVKTLESLLDLAGKKIFSIVVFVGDSTFKTDMPDNVMDKGGFIKWIKGIKLRNQAIFTKAEVKGIVDKIEDARKKRSFKTNREHVKHVRNTVAEKKREKKGTTAKKENGNSAICPRCESPLVVREAKKGKNKGGKFLGCSSYPRCRYMADLT